MTTHACARAIMLMAVSSFCSHQCPGHSICPTKHASHVCERERDFARQQLGRLSKEYWGVRQSPFSQNWMFDLLPGVRNYPPLDTKQGIDRMGHYTRCNAAETRSSENGGWLHGHICFGCQKDLYSYVQVSLILMPWPRIQQFKHSNHLNKHPETG